MASELGDGAAGDKRTLWIWDEPEPRPATGRTWAEGN